MKVNHDYDDSLTLFPNDYKTKDSHPVMRGNVCFSKKMVKYLVDRIKAGKDPILDAAAWVHPMKDGKKRVAISLQEHYEKPEEDVSDDPFADTKQASLDDDIPF